MPHTAPAGVTLVETITVLALLGALAAAGGWALRAAIDAASVRAAATELAVTLTHARAHAVALGGATVRFGPTHVSTHAGGRTLAHRPLATAYGVTLLPSRDSLTYTATGLGWGAANLRVIVRRNGAVDTVVVSRLGRVRH